MDEKNAVWSKKSADEFKKLDKLVKKEKNDFEDITGTGATNTKVVHDRTLKLLN